LSLTVSRKFSVLETELNASTFATASPPKVGVTASPAKIVESLGKSLVGEVVDGNDKKFGPVVFVGDATLAALEKVAGMSFCSQLYVIGSPSGSVAEPVNANGVVIGIVKFGTAATTGGWFAVIVMTPAAGHGRVGRLPWMSWIEIWWNMSIECGATSTGVMPA
jgi:hypothetical protein